MVCLFSNSIILIHLISKISSMLSTYQSNMGFLKLWKGDGVIYSCFKSSKKKSVALSLLMNLLLQLLFCSRSKIKNLKSEQITYAAYGLLACSRIRIVSPQHLHWCLHEFLNNQFYKSKPKLPDLMQNMNKINTFYIMLINLFSASVQINIGKLIYVQSEDRCIDFRIFYLGRQFCFLSSLN